MLHARSKRKLEEMEPALCRAAQHHHMRVLAVTHLGRLLTPDVQPANDVYVFTVCHSALYSSLLAADPRLAAFLPCRVAARQDDDEVALESVPPSEFCRYIDRDDLLPLALPLETALRELLREAALPAATAAAPVKGDYTLGATEGQMNVRGALPQRVDRHGTHVEDLAGTGKVDAPGG